MMRRRNVEGGANESPVEETFDAPTRGASLKEVQAAESNVRKILVRTISGGMFTILFNVVIWAGHIHTVLFIVLLQYGCFRELVRVGLDPALEKRLPGFLALQWLWFTTALCHVYGEFFEAAIRSNRVDTTGLPGWLETLLKYQAFACLCLFAVCFVGSVLTLQGPRIVYHYQIQRLAFTIVSLALIFGQMQGTPNAIFKGLIWYFLPSAIVATNGTCMLLTKPCVGLREAVT